MELDWERAGSLDDWSLWLNDGPVRHGEEWAAEVHSTGEETIDSATVQVSGDGIEWERTGLREGVFPGSLVSDGEWLVTEGEGALWVSTGDGTWDRQLEDQQLVGIMEAGPAGILALGIHEDGSGGVWRLEEGVFVDATPEGLDDIAVESLGGVDLLGLPDSYLVRMRQGTTERGPQEATDWRSPDGITWSEAQTEDVLNPGGNLIAAASVGSPGAADTTLVNSDGGLWRIDGPETVGLEAVADFPDHGAGVLSASEETFVYQTGTSSQAGPEAPRLWLSRDGYHWLEITGPPATNLTTEIDDYGLAKRVVIDTGTELIAYDTYGRIGGWGTVTEATTEVWTAPTPEFP